MYQPMKALTLVSLVVVLASCDDVEVSITAAQPIAVKIVLVTMFERGADSGDAPGEFQLWNERRQLDQVFPFQGEHDLHFNADSSILAIVTGAGTAKAAASVMALGMDPRFDLAQSYWLVAGIAGFDPADASIGSAAWAEYLVDGDLAHEIDAREKPDDWEWGYIARHTKVPFDPNRPEPRGEVFHANGALAEWAYQLTKDTPLPVDEDVLEQSARYVNHPNAQKPPFVLRGDNIAALTFWHGEILNAWANAWVDYWSDGDGEFVSSAMEDTGTFQSLTYLDKIGRVDKDRLMVLRTASNFTMPPPGVSAAENLLKENAGWLGRHRRNPRQLGQVPGPDSCSSTLSGCRLCVAYCCYSCCRHAPASPAMRVIQARMPCKAARCKTPASMRQAASPAPTSAKTCYGSSTMAVQSRCCMRSAPMAVTGDRCV